MATEGLAATLPAEQLPIVLAGTAFVIASVVALFGWMLRRAWLARNAPYVPQRRQLSSRQEGVYKIVVGLGIVGVTVLLVVHPQHYPAGDERAEWWYVLVQTAFGTFLAAVFIAGGILRLKRPRRAQ